LQCLKKKNRKEYAVFCGSDSGIPSLAAFLIKNADGFSKKSFFLAIRGCKITGMKYSIGLSLQDKKIINYFKEIDHGT